MANIHRYESIDKLIPQVGDFGFIRGDKEDSAEAKVVVVNHLIKKDTPCFLRASKNKTGEFILFWEEIGFFTDTWSKADSSSVDIFKWIYDIQPERLNPEAAKADAIV